MAKPSNFLDLQAGFFNALSQGLGFEPASMFQVIQPSPPIVNGTTANKVLFNYLNVIPPATLTNNTTLTPGNQFLSDYQGVMSALKAAPNTFESTVGPNCYAAYLKALEEGKVEPDPISFRNWALRGPYSSVAISGASALAAALLDPIFAAQMNVLPYKPAGRKDVEFFPDYPGMIDQLRQSPSRSFYVSAENWNTDISHAWTREGSSGFFGLWGGSQSTSKISEKFASSGVDLKASFGHVLNLTATPGDWYNSAALGLAYHNPDTAPWDPVKPINWQNTFGPRGNMQRFLGNLLVASEMRIEVVSQASYSDLEQTEIKTNGHSGLWPFYCGSGGGSSTQSSFDKQTGHMSVLITSETDVPIIIGCIVQPASIYVGGNQLEMQILHKHYYAHALELAS